jgi:mono/diheme cytochrome c family protein
MATSAQSNLAIRKAVFVLLLALIAAAIVYVVLDNRPWTVPEEAKQVKNPVQPSESALQSARSVYSEKCAHCHGDTGKGDGHDASSYDPAPTNFTDANHLRAATDGELFYKITQGHKPMPSYKKRLTEEQRWRMVLLIRSFASPGAEDGDTPSSVPNPAGTHP